MALKSCSIIFILTELRLKLLKVSEFAAGLSVNFTLRSFLLKMAFKYNFVFLLLFVYSLGFTQTTLKYNSEYSTFFRAEELFEKEQYAASRLEFRNFINGIQKKNDPYYIKALYYEGIAALELFNNDAVGLLVDFNRNYPESNYRHEIYFRLGKHFYRNKDFKEALVWFNQLSPTDVDPENRSEFLFKYGYAHFQEKNMEKAKSAFYEVKNDSSQYADPAMYYFSHICYQDGKYQQALEGFLALKTSATFGKAVPYYIVQIYYLQENYSEVTAYAPQVLDSANSYNLNDVNHIIGDSYYKLSQFSSAVPYLESYNKNSKTLRTDDYQLGFAYMKNEQYNKAIGMFDRVTKKKDSLAQIAYYHIAICYVNLDNKVSARSAFESAAKISSDASLQEDALYNYAILSYELDINPYDEAVIALERFLNEFPSSTRRSDVNQYLVNVYTSTNNYEKALASLEKIPNKDNDLKMAYQLVAFNRGVELFQNADYTSAIKAFELVERHPMDMVISARAKFWTADAHYRLDGLKGAKTLDKAIKAYRDFVLMPGATLSGLKPDAYYNLGYAYLKKNDASQSLDNFTFFTQSSSSNKQQLADAYLRIGDSHYTLLQNENAIKNYLSAYNLKSGFEDQALYYLAKSYGYAGNDVEKISRLKTLVNNYSDSKFVLSAIYELGITYKFKAEYSEATTYFNRVISEYPSSDLVVNSYIELADIYTKQTEYRRAESAYQAILEQYGTDSKVCEKVVRGLLDLYNIMKQPEKASTLASDYACANVSEDEKEGMFYAPGIEAYNDSSFTNAIMHFEKYLDRFPSGKYAIDARYFLANSYLANGNKEKAVEEYQRLLEGSNNSYTEYAASTVSQHLYNNGQFEQAIPYYQRLLDVTSKPGVLFNANLGLMRSNFLTENWEQAAKAAKAVLASSQLNNTLRLEAEYAHGFSNYHLSYYEPARVSLEWVVKNTTTAMGAESKFTLAEMQYQQKNYVKADELVRELIKMKPAYNYWIAKGLILQTRILMAQNDLFQAEQTLTSVIENYPDKEDDILPEANDLWDELMQMKNSPKSIKEEGETEIELNDEN
jgi:TolA-binding protein